MLTQDCFERHCHLHAPDLQAQLVEHSSPWLYSELHLWCTCLFRFAFAVTLQLPGVRRTFSQLCTSSQLETCCQHVVNHKWRA